MERSCGLRGAFKAARLFEALHESSAGWAFCISQVISIKAKSFESDYPPKDGFGLFDCFEKFEDMHFRNGVIKCRPPKRET